MFSEPLRQQGQGCALPHPPPPEMKLSSSYICTHFKNCFTSPSVTSFLRGAPLLRKILDPPLDNIQINIGTDQVFHLIRILDYILTSVFFLPNLKEKLKEKPFIQRLNLVRFLPDFSCHLSVRLCPVLLSF